MKILVFDGRWENLSIIRKFGWWSVRSCTILPLIEWCSRELKKMLSIRVAEWSVTLVGCEIWGRKKCEPRVLIKSSVGWWD